MDKRYTVFISSTYRDLRDERREVMQALLELDCIPVGMELFPAADEAAWSYIKKVIDDCDYYVVVIGGRYGSTDAAGIGYTEKEYDYAVERGIPVIAFLHGEPGKIPTEKSEMDPAARAKLDGFRTKAERKLYKHWGSPPELGGVVSRSLVQLIKRQPAVGWVRADQRQTEEDLQTTIGLRQRVEDLEAELERVSRGPPEGTEELAQGDDILEMEWRYLDNSKEQEPALTGKVEVKWNEIVGLLGPLMFDEGTETALEETLQRHVAQAAKLYEKVKPLNDYHVRYCLDIEANGLQTILMQMVALGIIEVSERKRYVRDTATYWCLTSYGKRLVPQLTAIKSKSAESQSKT